MISPTPYPDVNEILAILMRQAQEILAEQFIGMYLYGSLSSGDFDPETSDIDFLVVTADLPSPEKVTALQTMHQQLWSSGRKWACKLEGSYVPKTLIRRHDPDGPPCPTLDEDAFFLDKRGSDWIIQRHIVRECGVVLAGPDPKTLIDPVSPDDIRSAVLGTLREWWFPILEDPSWLAKRGSEYHAYAILTMCRVLHALEHGTIVSKPAAARWAQQTLDKPWGRLIDKAVAAARHADQGDFLKETLDFIRLVRERVIDTERRKGAWQDAQNPS